MKTDRLQLVRPHIQSLLDADARKWLETSNHCRTIGLLEGWGFADCSVSSAIPIAAEDDPSTRSWTHGYAHQSGALLQVVVPDALIETVCTVRFGGRARSVEPSGRGGTVKAALARKISDAVVDDLPDQDWTPDSDRQMPADHVAYAFEIEHCLLGCCSIRVTIATCSPAAVDDVVDASWRASLAHLVGTARLPLRAVIARPVISAGQVTRLTVGDVLPIRSPDHVTLLTGKRHLTTGTLIEIDGHASVRIASMSEVEA